MKRLAAASALAAALAAAPCSAEGFSLFAGIQPAASHSQRQGVDFDNGWAAGLEAPLGERWTAELMLSVAESLVGYSKNRGVVGDTRTEGTGDLSLLHRSTRLDTWTLRLGGGIRYQTADDPAGQNEAWAAVAVVALDWRFTPRLALRLDTRRALFALSGDRDRFPEVTTTLGLVARF
jgi:hypothetical protein